MIEGVINALRAVVKSDYTPFIEGHSHLTPEDILLAFTPDEDDRADLEEANGRALRLSLGLSNEYCIHFLAAGRMAISLAFEYWGIGSGDEVIVTAFTCSVVVHAVRLSGAVPVFAEVDPETLGLSADGLEARIGKRTKAIIAQHSFGLPCRIEAITALARRHEIGRAHV